MASKTNKVESHRVDSVSAMDDFCLLLGFSNGERRVFDVKPYLNKGIFAELRDPAYFVQVHVVQGAVAWPHEQDLSHDTLYVESQPF